MEDNKTLQEILETVNSTFETVNFIKDNAVTKDEFNEFKEEVNDMYVEEARHFLNCIKGKEKPLSDILSGKSVLEIALSAKESSEKGKVVKLKQLL